MLHRIKHLSVFFKDPNKKPLLKIAKELVMFGVLKKSIPIDYFRKYLYRKGVSNYKNYLSIKEYYSLIHSPKMVFPEVSSILNNKLAFNNHCASLHLPTPRLLSYHFNTRWFYNNTVTSITSEADVLSFFHDVFKTLDADKLFLKPILGQGGDGCILLKKEYLETQIATNYNALITHSYIHQVYIEQHDAINRIYNKSVNTIRIDTYIDKHDTVQILGAFMRFGAGGNATDNVHNGGFYVSVNLNSGQLQGVGRQDIVKGGKEVTHHPDSNIKLDGFQIPYYKAAFELVKNATTGLPNRIVGWDIAITNNGPILVEGNTNPSLHVTDVASAGYLNNKYIQEALLEL
ncbi:sugar-transfer associated ATP-grasp domain-containing protein [Algibacter miyuki]|uniref:Sugar-transfer associated ATP-grasp domain-containing protein n=1 Tax=Algibacter miyuki TaxID=1306933 RepID=A0ABV5GYF3_9FLAO|nr:sugar-transfer associated ATP-grasp domain-containing protein [Algibacter miyuki]MDN3667144.1 sugar-transfer associated ATP-grasp domain-containing protein [Algibacter miyuki]